jgi:hypothetical protein
MAGQLSLGSGKLLPGPTIALSLVSLAFGGALGLDASPHIGPPVLQYFSSLPLS